MAHSALIQVATREVRIETDPTTGRVVAVATVALAPQPVTAGRARRSEVRMRLPVGITVEQVAEVARRCLSDKGIPVRIVGDTGNAGVALGGG